MSEQLNPNEEENILVRIAAEVDAGARTDKPISSEVALEIAKRLPQEGRPALADFAATGEPMFGLLNSELDSMIDDKELTREKRTWALMLWSFITDMNFEHEWGGDA